MKRFRSVSSREQLFLLPRSLDEYVPLDDGLRLMDEVIEQLDLSSIEGQFVGGGRPAYSPRVLVKILAYGTLRGIRSSRELARATQENLRFMYLAQGEQPDFRTISNFRKRFHSELSELLAQTVTVGLKEGIITLEQVAIDGTKIRGSAGKNSFKTQEKLEEQQARLEELISKELKAGTSVDEQEDDALGDDKDGNMHLPPSLQGKKERQERVRKALEELKKTGAKRASTTDPECRFIKQHPSYNAQAAVDVTSGFAVGGYVTTSVNDVQELSRNVQNVVRTTGETKPQSVVADQGYATYEEIVSVEQDGIEVFVPLGEPKAKAAHLFTYDAAADQYTCVGGRTLKRSGATHKQTHYKTRSCGGCEHRAACCPDKPEGTVRLVARHKHHDLRLRMDAKMDTDAGRSALRQRRSTVEPLFGTIKFPRRLMMFCLRGVEKVSSLWRFELAVHNIAKLAQVRA